MHVLKWLIVFAILLASPHVALSQQPVVQCWQTESTTTPPRTNCNPGLATVTTTTSGSSLVLKTSSGTLRYLEVRNNTASAANVLVFDAASVPSDGGGQTPKLCRRLAASSETIFSYPGPGIGFGTGISVALSTVDCYTKTTGSTDAFITGVVQ